MTATINYGVTSLNSGQTPVTYLDVNLTNAVNTTPSRFVGSSIALQITGTATAFTLQVYRCDVTPNTNNFSITLNGAPVVPLGAASATITGVAGAVPLQTYYEPGVGFWAVSVSAVSGGVYQRVSKRSNHLMTLTAVDPVARILSPFAISAAGGALTHRNPLIWVGLGDSHTDGRINAATASDGSVGQPIAEIACSPLDKQWLQAGGTAPYFKVDGAINSVTSPNASNDQSFSQVNNSFASWLYWVPISLRITYPALAAITVANLGVGGSCAYTWAGECAYGYVAGLGIPLDGDTVTIAGTTYTFRAVPSVANDVLIGASGAASILNLENAVNAEGTGWGAGTVVNPNAWGMNPVSTVYGRFSALLSGTAGNSLTIASSNTSRVTAVTPALSPISSQNMTGGSATSAIYANAKSFLAAGGGIGTPSIISITLGTNDANRVGYRARGTSTELARLLANIHADFPNSKVIIWRTPTQGTSALSQNTLTNVVIPAIDAAVAANASFVSSVDMYSLGAGATTQARILNTTDGIHLTPYGYQITNQLFVQKAASLLGLV